MTGNRYKIFTCTKSLFQIFSRLHNKGIFSICWNISYFGAEGHWLLLAFLSFLKYFLTPEVQGGYFHLCFNYLTIYLIIFVLVFLLLKFKIKIWKSKNRIVILVSL